ncbi:metalloregulator ArsR/SmtB family transcription factor [Parathalassolituus penaei]|uniref:Metalloregulator ArsR/SmtB family transcription factor n=1 Tax=Parathalassolituus penaei TaxID=2997323 RepID=A0A9X3ISG4_9GAMM|nr:metalloregulator ArsR/SmtB family transcription factor [Parathalassolituus penaei]MCY0966352.1 metalloregulator ArsR/SmtB family transcription factor [Parathalassolituus penaei]
MPPMNHPAPALHPAELDSELLARACKAIGDPLRLGILRLLGQGSFAVLELCDLFDTKQSSMSHHLKILAQAGLVVTQREGNSIYYRRPLLSQRDGWQRWLSSTLVAIDQSVDADSERQQALQSRLQRLLDERAEACAGFFARNADVFRKQQDLIASWDQYGETLEAMLVAWHGPALAALEIGPGEGAFLPSLAKRFGTVVALDISSPMLERAAALVSEHQLHNVQCQLGDTNALLAQGAERFDLAVANMVLHHVPAPRTIFSEVAALLSPGGCFLVTDLCRHQQTWARESCGDLWLGFAPEDLTAWAREAGLREGQSQFLGLRNGFQIQFRLFHRP